MKLILLAFIISGCATAPRYCYIQTERAYCSWGDHVGVFTDTRDGLSKDVCCRQNDREP